MLALFPSACVFHLGLYRDKSSFTPTEYYSKLPLQFDKHCDVVYLLDPVVATGGTACAAVGMLRDAGIPMDRIKLLVVIASMPGLQQVRDLSFLPVVGRQADSKSNAGHAGLPRPRNLCCCCGSRAYKRRLHQPWSRRFRYAARGWPCQLFAPKG